MLNQVIVGVQKWIRRLATEASKLTCEQAIDFEEMNESYLRLQQLRTKMQTVETTSHLDLNRVRNRLSTVAIDPTTSLRARDRQAKSRWFYQEETKQVQFEKALEVDLRARWQDAIDSYAPPTQEFDTPLLPGISYTVAPKLIESSQQALNFEPPKEESAPIVRMDRMIPQFN